MVNNQNQNSNPTPATATVAPSQARGEIRSPLISAINITKMELVATKREYYKRLVTHFVTQAP